jgi:hypothetical protein
MSKMEVAVGAATICGGATWQLAREVLELSETPGDPLWNAALFAILLGSLAV